MVEGSLLFDQTLAFEVKVEAREEWIHHRKVS